MNDRSFIRSDPESPPAPGRYCQLFSAVAQMLGAPPVPADAVTKIWSIGTDGHLFSIDPRTQSAVLIQTLVLDELNGPLLIRALQKLADFGHRFRMDADRMTDDTPIKGDLSALL